MWIIEVVKEYLLQDRALSWIFFIATAALFLGVLVGVSTRSAGVYAVWSFTVGGGAYLASWGRSGAEICLACLFLVGGGAFLALFFLLRIFDKIQERKRRRQNAARALQFTLPDKDNSFVRARLHGALCVEEDERADCPESGREKRLPLAHAKKLIAALRGAALSQADRLAFEETAKLIALYEHKSDWSEGDARIVNEALAALIKTSAKYAV